ncbi:MAG TPA: rRNA methyltransferase [Natronosporangium sp.]
MAYRLAANRDDYQDLASGFVFRSAPGYPAFPVRLAEELLLRSAAHLPHRTPVGLWDPCCGSGYLASTVGLLHRDRLRHVLCSDADPDAVALARRNLSLLTEAGLAERRTELSERATAYGKPGYAAAARATDRLAALLRAGGGDLASDARVADGFDARQTARILPDPPPDLVLTDVPYGRQTGWRGAGAAATEPLTALAGALSEVLPEHAVIAVCAEARKLSLGEGVRALERFRVGKRAAIIVRAGDLRGLA